MNSPDHIRVELSWPEWDAAVAVGVSRHRAALREGRKPDWKEGNELENHIRGALGESAFLKWLGLYWAIDEKGFKLPDCVGNIQIRTTASRYHKVKPGDPGDQIVVFLECEDRVHFIKGCIIAREAQQFPLENPGNRAPCHHVKYEQMQSAAYLYHLARAAISEIRSLCSKHGVYPGDGNCPRCEAERVA